MDESDTNDNTMNKNDLMNISNIEQKEEELQEINFDQLLGEANQNEADFAEDREDDEVSDEEDSSHGDDNLADSLAFSKTNDLKELDAPPREELATPEEQNIEEDNTLNS